MRVVLLTTLLLTTLVAAAELPFDPSRGLVEVDVVLDGRVTGRFGLDTGADRVYIDRGFAERNGLTVKTTGFRRDIVGIDGSSQAWPVSVRSLQIDHDRLYNLNAKAIVMADLAPLAGANHPDGLLGHDVLRRFYVTVDYPQGAISLQASSPAYLEDSDFELVRFATQGHLVVVEVLINDDILVPMAVDYCASHTLVSPWLASQLGNPDEERIVLASMSLDNAVEVTDVEAQVRDLDPIRKGTDSQIEGILGATFLKDQVITVDYRRQRILIHDQGISP